MTEPAKHLHTSSTVQHSCHQRQDSVADRLRKFTPVDPGLRTFARGQRGDMPTAEALFWQQVRAGRFRGLKFKRQVPIAPYIVDFLCVSARLVVELDGPLHEGETRRRRDAERDAWLTKQGFQVLRFSNDLVLGNLGTVLDLVGAAVNARIKSPPPSAGEGGPRSGSGEGCDGSGEGAPLSRPSLTRGPPSPAEGRGK